MIRYLRLHEEKVYRDLQRAELERLDPIISQIPECPSKEALRKQLPILFRDKTSDKTFRKAPSFQHAVREVAKPAPQKSYSKEDALQAAAQRTQEQAEKIPKLSEPSTPVDPENLGFRNRVRDCVKKLSEPLDKLAKDSADPQALKEIEELASQYSFQLKQHEKESLFQYQQKHFKALEEKAKVISQSAPPPVIEALQQHLPLLFKPDVQEKSSAEIEDTTPKPLPEPEKGLESSPKGTIKALEQSEPQRYKPPGKSQSIAIKRAVQAGQFPSPLDESGLNGQDGIIFNGEFSVGGFGISFATVDANLDGHLDFIIGDDLASPGGNQYAGAAYIFFGPFNSSIAQLFAANLTGLNGFKIYGGMPEIYFGTSIVAVKNFTGNGQDRFAISAPTTYGGTVYLFDPKSVWPAIFYLANFAQADGTQFAGMQVSEGLGTALVAADFTKVGMDSLVMGSPLYSSSTNAALIGIGKFTLISGQNCSSPVNFINLTWPCGSVAYGTNILGQFALSLGKADYNNDTIPDLLIGGYVKANLSISSVFSSSLAYAIAGNASGLPSVIDVTKLDGNNGTLFYQSVIPAHSSFQINIGGFGKFTKGGADVIAIGILSYSFSSTGGLTLIEGASGGLPAAVDLSNPSGVNAISVQASKNGNFNFGRGGSSVGLAGDVNGDGKPDGVVGATSSSPSGLCAVSFFQLQDLGKLNGTDGFLAYTSGPGAQLGVFAMTAKDLNEDGIDDVGCSNAGQTFVTFGTNKTLPPPPSSLSPVPSTSSTSSVSTLSPSPSSSGPVSGGGQLLEYVGIALGAVGIALAAIVAGVLVYLKKKKKAFFKEKQPDIEVGAKHQPPAQNMGVKGSVELRELSDLGEAPPSPKPYIAATFTDVAEEGRKPYFGNDETLS